MSQLHYLVLSSNYISGTLPMTWGQQGAFAELAECYLDDNQLSGKHVPGPVHPPYIMLRL